MGSKASKRKKANQISSNAFTYTGPPIPNLKTKTAPTRTGTYTKEKKTKQYALNTNLYQHVQQGTKHIYNLRELTEIIMFGYVRTRCLIALERTPQDIIDLCLLFFSVGDEWDTNTSDSRLVHDPAQIVISKPVDCLTISRYYAFGKDNCKRGQKYLWKFKVTAKDDKYSRLSISIGVIDRTLINQRSFDVANNNDYLYDNNRYKLIMRNGCVSDGDSIHTYCNPLCVGDIIEMELDMTDVGHSTLSYWLNDIPLGVAFDNIPTRGHNYALCVAFQRRDKLQILPTFKKSKIVNSSDHEGK